MTLSSDEILLGHALRYLIDGNNKEAFDLLFQCSLKSEPGSIWDSRRITVVGPHSAHEVLEKWLDRRARAIKHAISVALPAVDGRVPTVEWVMRSGIVSRDPTTQTELTQLARGSDTLGGVVEALPINPTQRPLLVTPIPIFSVEAHTRDPNLCFVIMPFAASFQPVYDISIKPAVQAAGLTCLRGDDIMQPGEIMAQVWNALLRTGLVVADLTGVNGNVFYELGLAHVLGHQAILLTQDPKDVPFDLQGKRYLTYVPSEHGLLALRSNLEMTLRSARATVR